MSKISANSFFPGWVRQRELRQRSSIEHSDAFYKSLYSSTSPCHSWGGGETSRSEHRGLFSLEFSADGTLLVAGCENNSFLMFDPLSRKLIHTVHKAHEGCVTRVRFFDSHLFATGSTDTVSLWDTRNLKSRYQTLVRHSHIMANVEFSRKNDLLITSEICGGVYLWDLKNLNQKGKLNNTFLTHTLMRLRLNPDETKMIISNAKGSLLIIHELDLNTLARDLNDFLPETLESPNLQQSTGRNSSRALPTNQRRNRVEVVAHFPFAGDFHVVSALEIHPQGWCAISRSKSYTFGREWTCVYDIQEKKSFEDEAAPQTGSGDESPSCLRQDDGGRGRRNRLQCISEVECSSNADEGGLGASRNESGLEVPDVSVSLERGAHERRSISPADTVHGRSPPPVSSSATPDPLGPAALRRSSRVVDPSLSRPNSRDSQFNHRDHERFPRLTHFIEEPFFEERNISSLGVSADGRLMCSPLENGIRLLAFSPECSEQNVSWCGTQLRRLYELSTHTSHTNSVLCMKFSPRHCLLVSGCIEGKLVWYQPVL